MDVEFAGPFCFRKNWKKSSKNRYINFENIKTQKNPKNKNTQNGSCDTWYRPELHGESDGQHCNPRKGSLEVNW